MSLIIIVVTALVLGGVLLWWGMGSYSVPAVTTVDSDTSPPPSLAAPRPGGDSAAPPAHEHTRGWVDPGTRIATTTAAAQNQDQDQDQEQHQQSTSQDAETLPLIQADGPAIEVVDQLEQDADVDAPPRLAVLPLELMGTIPAHEADAGAILADLLLAEIDSDAYELYERARLDDLLSEQRLQASELANNASTAARFGQLAGIRYLVVGSLSRLGGEYHLSARVVDCTTGRVGDRGWVRFRRLDQAAGSVPKLVNLLRLRQGTRPGEGQAAVDLATASGNLEAGQELIDAVNPEPAFDLRISTAEDRRHYREGEHIRFVVEADRDCFVTLITVDSEGNMTLLLPNAWQRRAFVGRGASSTIPNDDAGFRFPIIPPHGETLVKAIATLQPLRLEGIDEERVAREQFVALGEDIKAIGLEEVPGQEAVEIEGDLYDLLAGRTWATAELTVFTYDPDESLAPEQAEDAGDGDARAPPEPFRIAEPADDDPNARVLAEWRRLRVDHLPREALALSEPEDVLRPEPTRRFIIAYRDQPPDGADGAMRFGMRLVELDDATSTRERDAALAQLAGDRDVITVIPNLQVQGFTQPQTHLRSVQWALDNSFEPGHDIGHARVADRLAELDDLPLIGLVDTGFNYDDPRLAHARPTENEGDPTHATPGWNFLTDSPDTHDPTRRFDHGSFVGSIIAARPTGSEVDVIGLLPHARIRTAVALQAAPPARRLAPPTGELHTVIEAIADLANQGAEVINLSLGAPVSNETLAAIDKLPLWDELERRGIILVCAAGNAHRDLDEQPVFPASLGRSNIVTVMASDAAGRPGRTYHRGQGAWVAFTNHGRNTVDLAAPGTFVLGIAGPDVDLLSGTSYAAAHVTAAVAIARHLQPDWSHQRIIAALRQSARPSEHLEGYSQTGGVLDLPRLFEQLGHSP